MVIIGVITATFELIDAIPLIPILALLTLRIARRIARHDDNPATVRFIMAAFWAKMLGTIIRSAVVAWYYDNRSDTLDYHKFGQHFAPMFRTFDFSAVPDFKGTNFMRFMTGVIYSFTGASSVSGAVVMSFLSFLGLLLLWRAFERAVPGGEYYRYGLLVFFLPSLLYWPSALGKEGWAVLCLGVASYGVAMVVTGSIMPGITVFLLGVVGVLQMRPHVALVAFFGVLLAALVDAPAVPVWRRARSGSCCSSRSRSSGCFCSSRRRRSSASRASPRKAGPNTAFADAEGRTSEAGRRSRR